MRVHAGGIGLRSVPFVVFVTLIFAWIPGQACGRGFLPNRGQTDEMVLYYQAGPAASVFLIHGAIVIDLGEPASSPGDESTLDVDSRPVEGAAPRRHALYLRFRDANAAAVMEARGETATRYNVFRGSDPRRWYTDIPSFAEVVYRDLWPGIDLVLRGEDHGLIYEVVAHAGADPRAVAFDWEGATAIRRPDAGYDSVETSVGTVTQTRSGGSGAFRWADGASEARDDRSAMAWCTYLGGSGDDRILDVVLDGRLRPIVAGRTDSVNFPTTPGAYDESVNGGVDAFVAIFSPTGTELISSTVVGGESDDSVREILVDPQGNLVLTGITSSQDFPTTPGVFSTARHGAQDAYVAKLSPEGDALLWSTFLGGAGDDQGESVALNAAGDVLVTGATHSSDFPTTPDAYDRTLAGPADAFVSALTADASALLWSTYVGGHDLDYSYSLAVDQAGYVAIAGITYSTTFPATPGAFDTSFNGAYDTFVTELLPAGTDLRWSTFLGGHLHDPGGYAMLIDPAGNVVVTGAAESTDFPVTPGAYDTTHNGGVQDIFVTKIANSGHSLIWSTFIGSSGDDFGPYDLALDHAGDVVVSGMTYGADFPTTRDAYDDSFSGYTDAFVTILAASGASLVWSTFLGGIQYDLAGHFATDGKRVLVVAGMTSSPDFPVTPQAFDTDANGGFDGFVTSFWLAPRPSTLPSDRHGNLHLLGPAPGPHGGDATIRFAATSPVDVAISIYGCDGRLVRNLGVDTYAAGQHGVVWDGRDRFGRPAAAGIYIVRLAAGGQVVSGKLALMR